jgi:hypothetical protein
MTTTGELRKQFETEMEDPPHRVHLSYIQWLESRIEQMVLEAEEAAEVLGVQLEKVAALESSHKEELREAWVAGVDWCDGWHATTPEESYPTQANALAAFLSSRQKK